MSTIKVLEAKIVEIQKQHNAWLIDNPTQCRVLDNMDMDLLKAEEALAAEIKASHQPSNMGPAP